MAKLSGVNYESLRELLGNFCLTACTLAINAASAATFKTTGTTTYTVDGRFRTKAALAAQAFSPIPGTVHSGLAIGQTGYYVVGLDAAGAVRTFEGIGALPDVADGFTPIGIIKGCGHVCRVRAWHNRAGCRWFDGDLHRRGPVADRRAVKVGCCVKGAGRCGPPFFLLDL